MHRWKAKSLTVFCCSVFMHEWGDVFLQAGDDQPTAPSKPSEDQDTLLTEGLEMGSARWGPQVPLQSTAAADTGDGLVAADGRYSPESLDPEEIAGQEVVPEEEDRAALKMMREQVRGF